ncbi:MAG: hypothetical protein KDK39_16650 [Leptospiraceae bacterium]|nr:hypothetical protein [Leptospiraceae bacterium]
MFNFTNDSFEPDVNRLAFLATRDEISRRHNFFLQADQSAARWFVYGSITAFRRKGLMYDDFRNPSRLEFLVLCRLRIYKQTQNERSLVHSEELSARVSFSPAEGVAESEQSALQRLSRLLARQIATVIEKQFLNQQPQSRD